MMYTAVLSLGVIDAFRPSPARKQGLAYLKRGRLAKTLFLDVVGDLDLHRIFPWREILEAHLLDYRELLRGLLQIGCVLRLVKQRLPILLDLIAHIQGGLFRFIVDAEIIHLHVYPHGLIAREGAFDAGADLRPAYNIGAGPHLAGRERQNLVSEDEATVGQPLILAKARHD